MRSRNSARRIRIPTTAIREGIEQVLATPDLEGDIELVQPKVYYEFADPNLESLNPLQKQLLRMGPQNLARIKGYLMQVKGHSLICCRCSCLKMGE